MTEYLGDVPILNGIGMCAVQQSFVWRETIRKGNECLQATQAQRGQDYYNMSNGFVNYLSYSNDYQLLGTSWWGQFDFDTPQECNNWGVLTPLDNPYDGICDQPNQLKDPWGYTCGGEEFPYGDAMTSIKQANRLWWHVIVGPIKAIGGGERFREALSSKSDLRLGATA